MKVPTLRRSRADRLPGISGTARVGRRIRDLAKRLRPGDIAVIDKVDIDRVDAEALVACRVAAVINASPSISGRYPNVGPRILVEAGIPLVDGAGDAVTTRIDDGDSVRLDGETVYVGSDLVAAGTRQTSATVGEAMDDARAGLSFQLEAFTANAMEYLKKEHELLLDGVGIPRLDTDMRRRHCVVVVHGYRCKEDLRALRSYLREYRPVLVGVDAGADVLLECGYSPNLIVGDMEQVSDEALNSRAEIVVHAHRDGRAPGLRRVEELGIEPVVFSATGTSEDAAMLLADNSGASLIVGVGSHFTLMDFLDRGRAARAGTFLSHLRVGGKLVDAKAVVRLCRPRISGPALLLLVAACLSTILVAGAISPAGDVVATWIADLWNQIVDLIAGLSS